MGTRSSGQAKAAKRKTKRTEKHEGKRPDYLTPLADPRDEEILGAAFQIFTQKGFHGATMLDVARLAHASKTTLYARFRDKEGLFRALLEWGSQQPLENLRSIVEDDAGDPETALLDFAVTLGRINMRPGALALYRVTFAEASRFPQFGQIFNSLTRDRGEALFRRLADRLRQAGRIECEDPRECGDALIGLLRGDFFFQALLGTVPPPSEAEILAQAKRAVSRVLRAFAPDRRPD